MGDNVTYSPDIVLLWHRRRAQRYAAGTGCGQSPAKCGKHRTARPNGGENTGRRGLFQTGGGHALVAEALGRDATEDRLRPRAAAACPGASVSGRGAALGAAGPDPRS